MKKDKIILTDCDGVLLDWEEGFSVWMEHHGHEKVEGYQYLYNIGQRYGMSSEAGNKLVNQYKFICITSLSLDPYAEKLRRRNLRKLMGDAFLDVVCLDTGADKDIILEEYGVDYPGAYWIEDKPENVDWGIDAGLSGILIEHGHNMDYNGSAIIVKNWKEIYNLITFKGD